ncbi:MAG: nuclear transport factor 2 family protein [Acidocella sp.]|nr:nuclear transport factor 2 family protein [Acidocella sp.]
MRRLDGKNTASRWLAKTISRDIMRKATGEFSMSTQKYVAYEPAAAYFDLVRGALGDLVYGEHFFDTLADEVIYEVLYDFPGWPRVITGRTDLMAAFRGYVDNIALQSADRLIVHKADGGRVVVIEYEVHGTILATDMKYNNRFCSIIKIENRKIAHWRDYMDSLAAWNALTAQKRG